MSLNIPNLTKNTHLSPFTTYKIGGPADFFVEVHSAGELINAVSEARRNQVPFIVIGCGANILFTDKGFRGLVVRNLTNKTTFLDHNLVNAESGVVVEELINKCQTHGLSGLEHFTDIPSSVGGAIWQNLHFLSPDRQRTVYISEVMKESRILTEEGETCTVEPDYFQFGYDTSILHKRKDIVLDVTFRLTPKFQQEILDVIEKNRAWRNAKHPQLFKYPNCGSVFKKIKGIGAGRLIEQAGLKGKRFGDAMISEKHANFILNLGDAKAADVLALITHIQNEIRQQFGYSLETEITIIGEK